MVNVVGYATFINKESLIKTINPKDFKLVLIKGFRRIFNQRTSRLKMYDADPKLNKVAIASIIQDEKSLFNAVMFEVDDYEFLKLKIREKSAHQKKINVYDIKTNEKYEAIIFIGNKNHEGMEMQNNDYLPIEKYLKKCRQGAYSISEEFGNQWDETTYLGNGKSIKEYLKGQG